jgi:hypothetical protein
MINKANNINNASFVLPVTPGLISRLGLPNLPCSAMQGLQRKPFSQRMRADIVSKGRNEIELEEPA